MDAEPLLLLGLLIVAGLLAGLAVTRTAFPRVAAYVLAGVAFSPDLLGRLTGVSVAEWSGPLTTAALGLIAFLIGGSMTGAQIRRMGNVIAGAALGESLVAAVAVFGALALVTGPELGGVASDRIVPVLGAIAATTAPAATVAVLHQFRARGPLSTTLLGVVAVDDVIGILLFSLVVPFVGEATLGSSLGAGTLSIAGGLALGIAGGWLLAVAARRLTEDHLLPAIVGAVLLVVGVAELAGFPPLLAAMATGFVGRLATGAAAPRLFARAELLEETAFLVFFTVAGAQFRLGVFVGHVDLVVVYVVARAAGKMVGAAIGARLAGAPPVVARWLGLALTPQAGVAVGLALAVEGIPTLRSAGPLVVNLVLATTLVYEVTGPIATRYALARAGELGPERERNHP